MRKGIVCPAEDFGTRCMYSGDDTPAARRGQNMCPVARLPTFPGSGPIRRPDALEQAGPRNIVASRFYISRLIQTLITST